MRKFVLLGSASLLVLAGFVAAQNFSPERIGAIFQSLDKNNDQKLDPTELKAEKIFKFLDKNKDGFVTKVEAMAIAKVTPPPDPASRKPVDDSPRQGPKVLKPSDQGVGRLVADLQFTDLSGKKHRLSDYKSDAALVIAFTSTSCPLCKKYAPALARLENEYRERKVPFLFVNPIATDETKHNFDGAYVHDKDNRLAAALQARSTTEVFVLDSARTLVYRGAVDDQYGIGYSRESAQTHYLKDALEAVLAGKKVYVAATEAPGCALEYESPAPDGARLAVSYHDRVSRILQNHCVECHRSGGVGPFSLTALDDVRAHKGMIRKVVERGMMPPWFASKSQHTWSNDTSLSLADKTDLLAWLDAGLPEGNAADAPKPRTFPAEWRIGKPDAVYQLPRSISIKEEGVMSYQNVVVDPKLEEDRWIQAVEIQPTDRGVVHHVLVFLAGNGAEAEIDERQGFFAAYVPGTSSAIYPAGFAKKVPKGSKFRFQLHYTPNGTATEDQTKLALIFSKEPPRHEIKVRGIPKVAISIPPGTDNHAESASLRLPGDVNVTAFMPHMHLRGKAFKYEATLPDGSTRTLLDIPRYDFNWQLTYRLAEPISLPRGTTVKVTGWYDNSANNPANPDPTKTVRWGPQTFEEMLLGYVEYYVP